MKRNADLSYLDTSNLSFVRRGRKAADEGTLCSVDHAWRVATALGESARADNAGAWGMIPTAGFISFEVA